MTVKSVTVVVPVGNLQRAAQWYRALFQPDEEIAPTEDLVEFRVGPVWIQLFETEARPSGGVLRFGVDDLEEQFARVRSLRIAHSERIADIPGLIRHFDFSDPDGNRLSFYWLYPEA